MQDFLIAQTPALPQEQTAEFGTDICSDYEVSSDEIDEAPIAKLNRKQGGRLSKAHGLPGKDTRGQRRN